jgi:hypothetical protein
MESLLYVLCYLRSGSLPVIEYINESIEVMDMNRFFNYVFEYRKKKELEHQTNIRDMLGSSMVSAFENIKMLGFNSKPNYKLIKFLISRQEDERLIVDFE